MRSKEISSLVVYFLTFTCALQMVDGSNTNISVIQCPHYELANGNVTVVNLGENQMNNTYQATIRLNCNLYYELFTNSFTKGTVTFATCQQDGTWSTMTQCQVVRCQTYRGFFPPEFRVSDGMGGPYTYNSTFTEICQQGYYKKGNNDRWCGFDGVWYSKGNGGCVVITCPDYELANGSVSVEKLGETWRNNTYSASLTLTCKEGYVFSSPHGLLYNTSITTICQSNGTWTTMISCEPIVCRSGRYPSGFQPAEWHLIDGIAGPYSYLSLAKMTCNQGYYMDGPSEMQCGLDGFWHPDHWGRCVAKRCNMLLQPEFGKIATKAGVYDSGRYIEGTWTYNTTVTIECDPGYRLNGDGLIVCLDRWNGTLGNCSDVDECRDRGNACSNKGVCSNSQGSFNCSCFKGFIGKECETAIVCPVLDLDQHRGIYTFYGGIDGIYSYKSRLSIKCPEGYQLKGASSINCTESGSWSGTIGTCEVTRCKMPDVQPDKSSLLYWPGMEGNGTYNGTISMRCEEGYNLIGNGIVRCSHFGLWNGSLGNCSVIDCGWPTNITHNSTLVIVPGITHATSYNATIQRLCSEQNKHSSTEPDVIQCTSEGVWKGNLEHCKDEHHINTEADVGAERDIIIPIAVLTPLCLVLIVSVIVISHRLRKYSHIVKQHRMRNYSADITLKDVVHHTTHAPGMVKETLECHGVDDHVTESQTEESSCVDINNTGPYEDHKVDNNIRTEYEQLTFTRGST